MVFFTFGLKKRTLSTNENKNKKKKSLRELENTCMTSGYYWFRDKSKLIKTRFSMQTGFDFNQIGDKLVFTLRLYCNTDGKILFF